MTLAININGVSSTGFARRFLENLPYLWKPNIGYFQLQIKHWRRRVGKNLITCTWKQILRSFILWFFRRSNPIFHISYGSRAMERCLNTTFGPKHPFWAIIWLTFGIIKLGSSILRVIRQQGVRPDLRTKFEPNWRYFRHSNLTFFAIFDVFTQNFSQSGCYDVILKIFLQKIWNPNQKHCRIASSKKLLQKTACQKLFPFRRR